MSYIKYIYGRQLILSRDIVHRILNKYDFILIV